MTTKPYIASQPNISSPQYKQAIDLVGLLKVELTERCNNDCVHCYINLPQNDQVRSREMSTNKVISILQEAASLGCLDVLYSGGEPLLRKDFPDIYIATRQLGMRVVLFTNATLLTQSLIDLFQRIRPLKPIEVTLYGMTKESYEAVTRTPGSFARAMNGISLLQQSGVPYVVKWMPLPQNKHEHDQYEEFVADIPWMLDRVPRNVVLDFRARRDDPKKNLVISALRPNPDEFLAPTLKELDLFHRHQRAYCASYMHTHKGNRLFNCGAGRGGCVDAYGIYQLCMVLRHPNTTCDLKTHSLTDALTKLFPPMLEMKAQNAEYLSSCAKCFISIFCDQCPAMSWMEHGNLDTPVVYLCEITHAKARLMGLLSDDEYAPAIIDGQARLQAYANGFSQELD